MSRGNMKKSPDLRLKGSDKLIKIRRPPRETRLRTSLGAQTVNNLPEMQETPVHTWVGKSPGEEHDNPLQYSCLENPMDRGA